MGVNGLWSLLTPVARRIALETLAEKRLAVDASIWLYQFQMAMRDKKTGEPLQGAHIMGTFRRIVKLLFHGIKPVFVFDGDAPMLKKRTIAERRRRKAGASRDLAKTAQQLLAAQLRAAAAAALKKKASKKGKEREMPTGDIIDSDVVYLEDLDPDASPRKKSTPAATKFVPKDQYHLPSLEGSLEARLQESDSRVATKDEVRDFFEGMRFEDFDGDDSKVIDSEFFANLPVEAKYEIIGDLRIKSRQVNHRRVEEMKNSATPLDFSLAQIKNLQERNTLTQKLFSVTDAMGQSSISIPTRVAGQRNREYLLVKQDVDKGGGWVLGVKNPVLSNNEPLVIDTTTDESGSEGTDSDEFEEVGIPNIQTDRAATPDVEVRRALAIEAIRNRYSPAKKPPALDPFLDQPSASRTRSLFQSDQVYQQELEGSMDPDLQAALLESALMAQISQVVDSHDRAVSAPRTRADLRAELNLGEESDDSLEYVDSGKLSPVRLKSSVRDVESEDSEEFEEVVPRKIGHQRNFPAPFVSSPGPQPIPTATIHDSSFVGNNPPPPSTPSNLAAEPRSNPIEFAPVASTSSFMNTILPSDSESDVDMEEVPIATDAVETESTFEVDPDDASEKTRPVATSLGSPSSDLVATKDLTRDLGPLDDDEEPSLKVILGITPSSSAPPSIRKPIEPVDFDDVLPMQKGGLVESGARNVSPPAMDLRVRDSRPKSLSIASADAQIAEDGLEGEEDEEPFEWERSPTPPPRRPAEQPLFKPLDEDEMESDAAQAEEEELQMQRLEDEQQQYADMISQLKNRKLDDMQKEAQNDITRLTAQKNADQRNADGVTRQMANDIKDLLSLFGIPYVDAPEEAEAECAELMARNLVDGIVTDDSDVFLFGGSRIYRNMFNDNKYVECYLLSDLEKDLGLDRGKLVRLAYLLGGDYADGLPGVGPVLGMELLHEFPGEGGLDEFKEWWEKVQKGQDSEDDLQTTWRRKFKKGHKKLFIDDQWPNPIIAQAYYKPAVNREDTPFSWAVPDLDGLRSYLNTALSWSESKTNELMLPLIKRHSQRASGALPLQTRLTAFSGFDFSAGHGPLPPRDQRVGYNSARLQNVVQSWRKEQRSGPGAKETLTDEDDLLPDRPPKRPSKPSPSKSKPKPKPKSSTNRLDRDSSPPPSSATRTRQRPPKKTHASRKRAAKESRDARATANGGVYSSEDEYEAEQSSKKRALPRPRAKRQAATKNPPVVEASSESEEVGPQLKRRRRRSGMSSEEE